MLPGRTAKSIRERFHLLKKKSPKLPRHDELILELASQLNHDWGKISEDQRLTKLSESDIKERFYVLSKRKKESEASTKVNSVVDAK